jgi:hypothetical protein
MAIRRPVPAPLGTLRNVLREDACGARLWKAVVQT